MRWKDTGRAVLGCDGPVLSWDETGVRALVLGPFVAGWRLRRQALGAAKSLIGWAASGLACSPPPPARLLTFIKTLQAIFSYEI